MRCELFIPELGMVPVEEIILALDRAVEGGYDGLAVAAYDKAIATVLALHPEVDS